MTPNPAARAEEALGPSHPEVSRAFIGVPTGSLDPCVCLDEEGLTFTEGAVVGVRFEPGRHARCSSGTWLEDTRSTVAAQPLVRLELEWPDGA